MECFHSFCNRMCGNLLFNSTYLNENIAQIRCFPFDEIEFGKYIFHLLVIQIYMNIYFRFLALIKFASTFPLFLYLF